MYEQSHRDYLRFPDCHHRLPVMVVTLIITIDNAITYKAQRDKNAQELKLANAAITDMQRCVSVMLLRLRCKIHEGVSVLKLKMMLCVMMALVVVGCTSNGLSIVREAPTTASGVDNAASPRLADTAFQDYFTLRLNHYAKTTGRNPEVY